MMLNLFITVAFLGDVIVVDRFKHRLQVRVSALFQHIEEHVPRFQTEEGSFFEPSNRHSGGGEKVVEDAEFEAILSEDSYHTQEELSESLDITAGKANAKGISPSHCYWGQKIMGIARWSYCYVNTSADEYPWLKSHALRLVGDQLDVIYYELLKTSETITGDAPEPCSIKKKNGHNTTKDTIMWSFYSIFMLDLTRWAKLVKKYLETLKWEILSHLPYSPDVAPSDFHLTHLAQWHPAWLTSTSARMKK
nr:transposase [Hymenolepis microstoma]